MTTAVITLRPDETLDAAEAEMKLAAIRHIPVVNERKHLVGILSDRDILREFHRRGAKKLHVHEIMTKQLETIRDSAPAHEAAALMLKHKISSLPVVGDEGQLVGVVTETDFMRIAHEALGGEPWDL
ncbi:CBS domain-containing protein [Haliangium sp.]|uniref:CBS domain-containing protein n=1 Tax=Haliangium sp. TaxID=2663208 RepID=UPI003D0EDD16